MRALLVAASLLAAAAQPANATSVADNFETYAPGAFPSPAWLDAGGFFPLPPAAALPSATVEVTTDAFGAPTQALALSDQVALVSGIYQIVPLSTRYSLAADIRVDRFSDNAVNGPPTDYAIEMMFAQANQNFYQASSAGIYASSQTQGWRIYALENPGVIELEVDIDLGLPVVLGQWYRVGFEIDTTDGSYRATVADAASGVTLVDSSGVFAGWQPGFGQYDAVVFFEGEGSDGVTTGNLSFVDNIGVTATPAPAALALFGLGAALLLGARHACRHG